MSKHLSNQVHFHILARLRPRAAPYIFLTLPRHLLFGFACAREFPTSAAKWSSTALSSSPRAHPVPAQGDALPGLFGLLSRSLDAGSRMHPGLTRPLAVAVPIWFVGLLGVHTTSVYSYRPGLFGLFCGFPDVSTTLASLRVSCDSYHKSLLVFYLVCWLFVPALPHWAHPTFFVALPPAGHPASAHSRMSLTHHLVCLACAPAKDFSPTTRVISSSSLPCPSLQLAQRSLPTHSIKHMPAFRG